MSKCCRILLFQHHSYMVTLKILYGLPRSMVIMALALKCLSIPINFNQILSMPFQGISKTLVKTVNTLQVAVALQHYSTTKQLIFTSRHGSMLPLMDFLWLLNDKWQSITDHCRSMLINTDQCRSMPINAISILLGIGIEMNWLELIDIGINTRILIGIDRGSLGSNTAIFPDCTHQNILLMCIVSTIFLSLYQLCQDYCSQQWQVLTTLTEPST